jgi:hypothetical protein
VCRIAFEASTFKDNVRFVVGASRGSAPTSAERPDSKSGVGRNVLCGFESHLPYSMENVLTKRRRPPDLKEIFALIVSSLVVLNWMLQIALFGSRIQIDPMSTGFEVSITVFLTWWCRNDLKIAWRYLKDEDD